MKPEIPKTYNAKEYEDKIYRTWEKSGFFNPDKLPGQRPKSFSISMPPPNATGVLHLGHSVMLAIQDLVIRFQRMSGKLALWLPGTDHAAIATQTKVEKLLKEKEGKSRHNLGREEFLKRVEQYVKDSQDTIRNQIRKMGSSCDWSRERYTMDEGLTQAVQEAFVRMYQDGLIYRGDRIVNWCPQCASTLADDEVEYKPAKEKLYWIKYGPFVLATARPETKLGDTAVAVHPDDERYKKYVGKKLMIPGVLGDFEITVVADKVVDRNFGSGVIKVTPAHDFTDYEIARRHQIPLKKIIDEDGKMMANCGKYAGLTTQECRKQIVKDMEKMGLIKKIEDYEHNLSICYRCENVVEPLISKQWFIDVNKPVKKFGDKSLKEKALAVVKNGEIEIIPERFKKVYYYWLENLRDWCISRQIWFGHRIPVYYKRKMQNAKRRANNEEEIYVGLKPPTGNDWQQDPDTLDTWFSSGLWTFSTLGWPDKTKDLKIFHPTSLMETGYDILFFWVARMIIMSTYLTEEIPFKQVYLHGLVRDKDGRKMSKSLGNTIDPLDMIEKFGADAVRLSLLIGTTPGNDTNLSEEKIAGFRNFINKLWNVSRYILMTVAKPRLIEKMPKAKTLADRWILAKFSNLVHIITEDLNNYRFSAAGELLYEFTWSELADWYLEISKIEKDKNEILLFILQELLKLWHPFCPFVTEVIWKNLSTEKLLIIQEWPETKWKKELEKLYFNKMGAFTEFKFIQELIVGIRNLRQEKKIPPAQKVKAIIISKDLKTLIKKEAEIIKGLANLSAVQILPNGKKPKKSFGAVLPDVEIYLPFFGIMDLENEKRKLEQAIREVGGYVFGIKRKMENKNFIFKAPKEIIEKEKEKLAQQQEKLEKLKKQLAELK